MQCIDTDINASMSGRMYKPVTNSISVYICELSIQAIQEMITLQTLQDSIYINSYTTTLETQNYMCTCTHPHM